MRSRSLSLTTLYGNEFGLDESHGLDELDGSDNLTTMIGRTSGRIPDD